MTGLQKMEAAVQEKRRELRKLAMDEETTTEALETAEVELTLLEKRAALASRVGDPEPDPEPAKAEDSEGREVRKLASKARVGAFVAAALTGQPVKGASAEYAAALGVDGMLPLTLLEPETRAVTPGPSDETVTSTRPTVPYAFQRTDAAALGVSMPLVSPGEAHFPALTTAPPAGPKAEDAAADATAAAFALAKRTPTRITGALTFRREDQALFPPIESDLRRATGRSIADSLDKQIINGNGTAPNLSGLFGVATDVSAAGSVETFATGVARIAALVDGTHANGWGDIRLLIGSDTFELYASLFQSNGDVSLYDYLAGKLGAVRVSDKGPAKASNAQKGLALLTAQGQSVQVPVWSAVELVRDIYGDNASKGHITITAIMLAGSPFVPYGTSQVVEIHPKLA